MMNCVFCNKQIAFNTFLETDNFRSVINISPILPGHSLVIPKKHVESIFNLDTNELEEMMELANKTTKILLKTYCASGFDYLLMEGEGSGQRIKHIHLHILPRRHGDMGEDPRKFFFELLHGESTGRRKKMSKDRILKIIRKIKANIN